MKMNCQVTGKVDVCILHFNETLFMTMVVKYLSGLIKSIEAFEPVTVFLFFFIFFFNGKHPQLSNHLWQG